MALQARAASPATGRRTSVATTGAEGTETTARLAAMEDALGVVRARWVDATRKYIVPGLVVVV